MAKDKIYNIYNRDRSPVLIAKFKDGYTSDFYFALPEAYRSSLDIKWTPKQENLKVHHQYTQGRNYEFSANDIIYDKKEAYTLEWNDALKIISFYIKVISAVPASDEIHESIVIVNPEVCVEKDDKMLPDKKPPSNIFINKYKYNPGRVDYQLHKLDKQTGKFTLIESRTVTQEEFVEYLQSGEKPKEIEK